MQLKTTNITIAGGGQKKGKSKKWKNYLQFPHYTECLPLKTEIEVTYVFVFTFQLPFL